MLLSVVNTQLRDRYPSLAELAAAQLTEAKEIEERLGTIDYHYDESRNQFV